MAQGARRSFVRIFTWLVLPSLFITTMFGLGVYLGDTHREAVRNVARLFGVQPGGASTTGVDAIQVSASGTGGAAEEESMSSMSRGRPWALEGQGGTRSMPSAPSGVGASGGRFGWNRGQSDVETDGSGGLDGGFSSSAADAAVASAAPGAESGSDAGVGPGWPEHPLVQDGGLALTPPVLPDGGWDGGSAAEQCADGAGQAGQGHSPAVAAAVTTGGTQGSGSPTTPSQGQGSDPSATGGAGAPPDLGMDAAQLAMPITIRAKVLVDERFVFSHPDWLREVQSAVARASSAMRLAVRVDVELMGVLRFAEPLDGTPGEGIRQQLLRHPLEGADVLLAFVEQPGLGELCLAPEPQSLFNRQYGAVAPDASGNYLGGTLRCLSALFGAEPVTDEASVGYRLGSWMRPGSSPAEGKAPWLDPGNRMRILRRKALPFGEDKP